MARRRADSPEPPAGPERIVDIDVTDEMQASFLEYAYSVIYARALPDARDGLKPVQRRIVYSMIEMGLRPDRGHVKSSRIVGEVMGKYHPHGDGAIYDALVRMAQDFSLRLPLVDGHGNFGSLDDGPAAPRYTEARPASAALLLTDSLDENVVDFVPNYDNQLTQPAVMPAAFPNLLVNGASGIAVGMATNMPPHNLVEVIAACRHLIKVPDASVEALMKFVPGPDLPTGGRIVGLDGIRDAYVGGRGSFRTRATVSIENITARKKGLVITELPYLIGPEKVKEKVRDAVQAKKLLGVSDIVDLTDHQNGLRLVIEIKTGFNPEAVLQQLYKLTPMEDAFGINNVCLVNGRPQTLGLRELLQVFVAHRIDVVRRRTAHRLLRAQDRLHLVQGLLIAILDIDAVIAIIRGSDDSAAAKAGLIERFSLSDAQAEYILELRLRRLTKFSRIELETERDELAHTIAELTAILDDEQRLRTLVSDELAAVAKSHGTPRRTVLLESDDATAAPVAAPLEVSDDPCWFVLTADGKLGRTTDRTALTAWTRGSDRRPHDVVSWVLPASVRGQVGLVTSAGRLIRLPLVDCPVVDTGQAHLAVSGAAHHSEFVQLTGDERLVGAVSLDDSGPGFVLATRDGVVKRVTTDYPSKDDFDVITLKGDDVVIAAHTVTSEADDFVFLTAQAQLLHFGADKVRPQGRAGGGIAGIKLAAEDRCLAFAVVPAHQRDLAEVVTVSGHRDALPGTDVGRVKVTAFELYPAKGRATGGVRAHRFMRDEHGLIMGWIGVGPAMAMDTSGHAVELPPVDSRRDGSGTPSVGVIAHIAGAAHTLPSASEQLAT